MTEPNPVKHDADGDLMEQIAHLVLLSQMTTGRKKMRMSRLVSGIGNASLDLGMPDIPVWDDTNSGTSREERLHEALCEMIEEHRFPSQLKQVRNVLADKLGFEIDDLMTGNWLSLLPDSFKIDGIPNWQVIQMISNSAVPEQLQYHEHKSFVTSRLIGTILTQSSTLWSYSRRLCLLRAYVSETVVRCGMMDSIQHLCALGFLIYNATMGYEHNYDDLKNKKDLLAELFNHRTPTRVLDLIVRQPGHWLLPSYDIFLFEALLALFGEIKHEKPDSMSNSERFELLQSQLLKMNGNEVEKLSKAYVKFVTELPKRPYWLLAFHYMLSDLDNARFPVLISNWVSNAMASASNDVEFVWVIGLCARCFNTSTDDNGIDKFGTSLISICQSYEKSMTRNIFNVFSWLIRLGSLSVIDAPNESLDNLCLAIDSEEVRFLAVELMNDVNTTLINTEIGINFQIAVVSKQLLNIRNEDGAFMALSALFALYDFAYRCHIENVLRQPFGVDENAQKSGRTVELTESAVLGKSASKDSAGRNVSEFLKAPINACLAKVINHWPSVLPRVLMNIYQSGIYPNWSLISEEFTRAGLPENSAKTSALSTSPGVFGGLIGFWRHIVNFVHDLRNEIIKHQELKIKQLVIDQENDASKDAFFLGLWDSNRQLAVKELFIVELSHLRTLIPNGLLPHLWSSAILPILWPYLSVELKISWYPLVLTASEHAWVDNVIHSLSSESFIFGSQAKLLASEALVAADQSLMMQAPGTNTAPSSTPKILNPFYQPSRHLSGQSDLDHEPNRYDTQIDKGLSVAHLIWGPAERGLMLRPFHLLQITLWTSSWRLTPTQIPFFPIDQDDEPLDPLTASILPPEDLLAVSIKVKNLVRSIDSLCKVLSKPSIPVQDIDVSFEDQVLLGSLVLSHAVARLVSSHDGTAIECISAPHLCKHKNSIGPLGNRRIKCVPPKQQSIMLPDLLGRLVLMVSMTAPSASVYLLTHCIRPLSKISAVLSKNLWKGVMKTYMRMWDQYFRACMDGSPPATPTMPRYPLPSSTQFHWGAPLLSIIMDLSQSNIIEFRNGLNEQSRLEVMKMIGLYQTTGASISDHIGLLM